MDLFCVRGHIGLFLIFWMSLPKSSSTSSAQAMHLHLAGGDYCVGKGFDRLARPLFNPRSGLITALVSPFHS
jgi:hypothetical protein